jgi:hypothetical protein
MKAGGYDWPRRDGIINRLMLAVFTMFCALVTAAWCSLLVWGATLLTSR